MRRLLFSSLASALVCLSACNEADPDPQPNTTDTTPTVFDMPDSAAPDMEDAQDQDSALDAEDLGAPDQDVPPDEGCGDDHPRVGWTATLSTRSHGVRGTAVIVDNCTVEVRAFAFDGRGLDVKLYGTQGSDFRQGWPMSDDLIRSTPYVDETIIGKLPADRTLDDLDAISVWCIDIPVDFGSGTFAAP